MISGVIYCMAFKPYKQNEFSFLLSSNIFPLFSVCFLEINMTTFTNSKTSLSTILDVEECTFQRFYMRKFYDEEIFSSL